MECDREKQRASYDPAKNSESGKRWRAANPDKVKASKRGYSGTLQRKAYASTWYQANRERIAEKRLAEPGKYRNANIASAKAWLEANPEKAKEHFRIARRKRRARAKEAGGTHTASDLAAIFEAQGGRCAYCRADLGEVEKHVDHVMPLALGGSNGPENLQYLCRPCNQSKGAKHPVVFARSLGLLL